MGEFDKYEIPYFKKNPKVDDLCKGRVTTEDMYKNILTQSSYLAKDYSIYFI